MHLLPLLEFALGKVDTWSTEVLRDLFIDEPSLSSIKNLAGFFYGNGIPFYMAQALYHLCNDRYCDRVTDYLRLHYVIWHTLKYMRHQAVYNNTTFKALMWLNCRGLDQMEFVVPVVTNVLLGVVQNGRAFDIRTCLFDIRYTVLQFE
jgi:hypothetical protein